MSTVDDAVEAGARAIAACRYIDREGIPGGLWDELTCEAVHVARAMWPILSARLREAHSAQWECGNPRHTNPDVGCPECCEVCVACECDMPCATVRELDRIDKEMGND